jgi:membrane protease YdiL (CAAX protease family)
MESAAARSDEGGWSRLDAAIVVALTLLMAVAPVVPVAAAAVASAAAALLALIAWARRCPAAFPVGLFFVACLALAWAGVRYSQIVLGGGLLVYAVVVRRVAWLPTSSWARRGSVDAGVWLLAAACALAAAVGLSVWFAIWRPDIDDLVAAFVPPVPLWLLIVGGVLFSMVNAAVEEAAFRGVLMHGLDSALGPGVAALALQALAFGALHIEGFPRGAAGVGLAMTYGLMMGIVRRRSGGLLAPWAAHVATDMAIAGIVLMVAGSGTPPHP